MDLLHLRVVSSLGTLGSLIGGASGRRVSGKLGMLELLLGVRVETLLGSLRELHYVLLSISWLGWRLRVSIVCH